MRRGFIVALALAALAPPGPSYAQSDEAGPIDLNRATKQEIRSLPVDPELADAIWSHREFVDYYEGAWELLDVPGMTPEMLATIKPLVRIEPIRQSIQRQRKDDLFYRFERWEGAEGRDESVVEHYVDLAVDPIDINDATLLEISNLQNASPVDARAVVRYRNQVGTIGNRSELRRAPGLSGWGYSNIRNFVIYEEPPDDRKLHGHYSVRLENTAYFPDTEDLFRTDRDPGQGTNDNWWDRLELDNPRPGLFQKLNLRYGRRARGGLVTVSQVGDVQRIDSLKGFVGTQKVQLGPVRLDKAVAGSYAVSWGQGVIMDNTDFFTPRKSGYNFGKRYDGILGDLSRSELYTLRGGAAELSWKRLRGVGFYSDDKKDGVLNADGTVAHLIRLTPRVTDEQLADAGLRPMRDVVREQTYGGNLRLGILPSTWIGVGGYESQYDRNFDPHWDPRNPSDKAPLVNDDDEDNLVAQDSEIAASFKGKVRRIYGFDFQWVYRQFALQGEYAELDRGGQVLKLGDDPGALVLSAYVQEENLNFLALFRDYDVAYDNPYQRSLSNYRRFKGTIYEDYFRLEDPLYGFLYQNAAQPQAERGFYFVTRYRFANPFIATIEWDNWRRQGDMSKYSRFVGRLEYRILFPLRLKLRQKWQNREGDNLMDPTIFNNSETIVELEYRLSRYDELQFRFGSSDIQWPPRGRLQGNVVADGQSPISGNNANYGTWWSGRITHNSQNGRIKVDAEFIMYEGFWWFFEKNSFRVVDGRNGFRTWAELVNRVSDDLTLRFRGTWDSQLRNTAVDVRQFNEEVGQEIDADNVKRSTSYFRLQADYTF